MPATYTLIASNTLTSDTASVTFSSIPGTYTDLVVKGTARNDSGGQTNRFGIRLNSDTGNKYSITYLAGDGAGGTSSGRLDTTVYTYTAVFQGIIAADGTASTFTDFELYLPSYLSTTKKPLSLINSSERNSTTGYIRATAGLVDVTSAVTSITFLPADGNFVSGSSFFLYGISSS